MFRKFFRLVAFLFGLSLLWVLLYRFVPIPFTPLMGIRAIEGAHQKNGFRHDWVPLHKISPHLVQAVIAAEDNRFESHYGFDFQALQKAYKRNQKKNKRKLGGSTISMQTAKNAFLWPGRNYIRKGLEAYFTLMIELCWGKKRIMEVYLNSIEMGPGIYGAEAAAQFYFKKPAAKLSKREAALIAAVLPAPRKRNPAKASAYVANRADKISRIMQQLPKQQLR